MSNQTATTGRFVLPVAVWGTRAPSHRISCVHLMNNEKNLITGSQDGQICIWELEHSPILSITPRAIIFGHTAPILCIADGDFVNKNTIVTSCDTGEMCLWNVDDGQCLETKNTQYTHTFMQSFKVNSKECRLFCIGHYAEILVIDPKTFSIRFRLSSKENPDWITSIHILQPPQLSSIVIIGLCVAGVVRIWTITDEGSKCLDPIYDNDRKALSCTKSVQIISNPESMRLILIVCPQQWQIYDATDFERLCTVEAVERSQWTGGNFITRDQVLVWSDRGEGYLYQVTTKRGTDKQPSATRLKAKLCCSMDVDKRFLYPPKMNLTSTSSGKLLVRGDNFGSITVWPVNTSTSESHEPTLQQSLESSWKQIPPGDDIIFTSSTYMPTILKMARAREDGRSHPLTIQNLKANRRDHDSYVVSFDIESIIDHLLHEPNLVMETVSILLSILQAWGFEEEAKKICANKPELLKNFKLACIGLASKNQYMSLLLPSYIRRLDTATRRSKFFSINFSQARLTGQCLSRLLFVPSSSSLPLYSSLRYTAVGLIGRGFTFWEPYLDVAKVLLGLLDLSCESDQSGKVSQNSNPGAPVSTSKQAARDALAAMALARPTVFITTLAREVAKYNSKQPTFSQQIPPILVRSKSEILRNISIIIEKMPLEVANLMVETMDLTLHCIDHSLLENRGLGEAFPAMTRFFTVSYCSSSRRIAVGTVTGNLAMYELRAQSKPQIVAAHKTAVSACSFSPDGKYLASYSAGDNKLCFWLIAMGLFGLGYARIRCVGSIDTPVVSADLIKSPSDLLRVARLIWVAGRVVILMFIDEREFRYQVAS